MSVLPLLLMMMPVVILATAPTVDRFNQWFASLDSSGVGLTATTSPLYGGLGVVPTRSGHKGETILSVPLSAVMHRTLLASLPVAALQSVASSAQCDDADLIAVALLMAKKRADEALAQWTVWVDALPSEFLAPFTFADNDALVSLFDAAMQDNVRHQRQQADTHFRTVQALVKSAVAVSRAEWYWALGMVNSRAWSLRGTRYFVPMADMFNMAPTEAQLSREHSFEMRGDDFAAGHKVVGDRVHVLADRDFVAGEELFETYGDNADAIYLQYHGFVPDVNPSACVDLRIDLPVLLNPPPTSAKVQILQRLKVPRFRSYCVRDKRYMPLDSTQTFLVFPAWLVDLISVDRLSEEQAAKLLADGRFAWRSPALAESSGKLVQTLIHRWAVAARAAYSVTLAQDDAALASTTLSPAERLVRQYTRNQKRILDQWIIPDPPEVAAFKRRKGLKTEL
jgi:hypothetical protein